MKKDYVIPKQLWRCGTSISAMEEAEGGQSRADFIAKLSMAYKEARETKYWLRPLRDSNELPGKMTTDMLNRIKEILRFLSKILVSSKARRHY